MPKKRRSLLGSGYDSDSDYNYGGYAQANPRFSMKKGLISANHARERYNMGASPYDKSPYKMKKYYPTYKMSYGGRRSYASRMTMEPLSRVSLGARLSKTVKKRKNKVKKLITKYEKILKIKKGGAKKRTKGKTPSHLKPWLNHMAKVRRQNPNLLPVEVAKKARRTYRG